MGTDENRWGDAGGARHSVRAAVRAQAGDGQGTARRAFDFIRVLLCPSVVKINL